MRIGDPCHVCPATADQVCPYSLWRSGCPAAKSPAGKRQDWHIESVKRQLAFVAGPSDVDLRTIINIESCLHRWSPCGCTSKPAACMRESLPMMTDMQICRECLAEDISSR